VDITYYDSGYIDSNYYVYTADAVMGLGTFIAEDYLEPDYFENTGIAITLTCEATKIRIVEASADLVANFSQSVNGIIDVRAEVTLSTIVSLSSQEIRLREFNLDCTSTLTQSTLASATFSPQLSFSSIASQLTAAFQNATGTITMETVVTVTAIVGVIKQFPLNQITGLGATSEQDGEIGFNESLFPPPVSLNALTVRRNQWTFSVWVKRDTITGEYQCIAEGLVQEQSGGGSNNNGGIALKNSDVRIRTNYDPDEPGGKWNGVAPTDTEWHHYLFRTHVLEAGIVRRWKLWIDGIYQGLSSPNDSAGDLVFAGRFGSQDGTLYGGLRLGLGLIAQDTGAYTIIAAPLLGGVAQVWMGVTTDDQFRVDRFYSGLLDMGDAGTSTGLPTPVFYNKLTTPYTGVTFNEGATSSLASAPLILPSIPAQFSVTAQPEAVLLVVVELASQSELAVTATKNVGILADVTAESTVDVVNTRTRFATVDLSVESSISVEPFVIRDDSATLTTATSLDCVNTRVRTTDVTVTAESTLTATIGEITEFTASLESQFTQVTETSRTRIVSATAESAVTVTAQIDDRTRDQSASLESSVTFTVTATRIPSISATLTSESTLTAAAEKFIVSQGTLTSVFTQTTAAFKVVFAQASLVVEGFQLTQGDILNFDPCRDIAVDQETRIAKILAESRLLTVDSESRTLKVPQETRVLTAEYETRVNIIQC
jgi:hypothetical protein